MTKYKKRVWIVPFFVLLLLLFFTLFFFARSQADRVARLSDSIIYDFRLTLSMEMGQLLSFSLALAQSGALKEALQKEDETKGYTILKSITQRFKKYTHMDSLRLQLLTPDFFIFARSWNQGFEGMPLWWFRDDLKMLKNNKHPKVGMETGRLLSFKSTIPIRDKNQLFGYLEVIELIDEFSIKLRNKGVEMFVLMDPKHLEKASLMRHFPYLFDKVIANQNYNDTLKKRIAHIDPKKLFDEQFLMHDEGLFLWEPMRNGAGDLLGGYLLVISKEMLESFETNSNDYSLLSPFSQEDIKYFSQRQGEGFGSFKNGYDRDLIGLLLRLEKEDKKELEAEARDILKLYEKNELIDIILQNPYQKKKIGEIR